MYYLLSEYFEERQNTFQSTTTRQSTLTVVKYFELSGIYSNYPPKMWIGYASIIRGHYSIVRIFYKRAGN